MLTYNLKEALRKVKSQKKGWVYIDQFDRDWDSGKPLETKDLQRIVKILKKRLDISQKVC
jgi:hypothetical protein